MPISKVIRLAPKVELVVLANVQIETFQGRMRVALSTVDEFGEPVRSPTEITDTFEGDDFAELIALMLPTALPAITAKMISRGTLEAGASVVTLGPDGVLEDGGSPSGGK